MPWPVYAGRMIETAALPIVDMTRLRSASRESRRAAARDIDRACTGAGFFYVRDRRLDRALFDQLLARARAYFGRDHAAKMADYIGLSENHSGYVPEGEEQFGEGPCDRKEAFDVNRDYPLEGGRRPLLGPNIWPDMPGFREDVLAYYAQVSKIGRRLFRGFALALGLEEDHFEPHLRNPPSQLRLIHYPHDISAEERPGIGAHTDYECFTLLFATGPGLQILDRHGAWIDVPLIEGTLILIVGDMMEVMSNGRYRATRHRVKQVREERYSFPLFNACDYDHVIAPLIAGEAPRYAPIKGGEHLFNQTARTFAYLKRRIASGQLVLGGARALDSFGHQAA